MGSPVQRLLAEIKANIESNFKYLEVTKVCLRYVDHVCIVLENSFMTKKNTGYQYN